MENGGQDTKEETERLEDVGDESLCMVDTGREGFTGGWKVAEVMEN